MLFGQFEENGRRWLIDVLAVAFATTAASFVLGRRKTRRASATSANR